MTGLVCLVPLLASLFSGCTASQVLATGYVEGEFALVAPIGSARIETLSVRRGDRLAKGDVIAIQETRDAELLLAEAVAAEAQAKARLANLEQGGRPEEIAVIDASLASARAELAEMNRKYRRIADLQERGFAAQSNADNAATSQEMAEARVAQLEAQLEVARLPGREADILAARAGLQQAMAVRATAQWRLGERTVRAPAPGTVSDIVLRKGEIAGPAAPIVSFLPDGAVKLKLFVPQAARSLLLPGTRLSVRCDGCAGGQTATISYVSDEPEFTPPVIYSVASRQKLVYLVEARPDPSAQRLRPGQIIDVAPLEPAQ